MTLRPDLHLIAELIAPGARVLDIGCGDGDLLAWLAAHRQVDGRGIEISQAGVNRCIARGLPVVQGDGDVDLQYYPEKAYDYAILSQTLQTLRDPAQVLKHLVRIARFAVVSVPNFGHWQNRLYLLAKGRMPVTRSLTYQWYDTPNIHFCTLKDFTALCAAMQVTIHRRFSIDSRGRTRRFAERERLANLLAQQGVFLLG